MRLVLTFVFLAWQLLTLSSSANAFDSARNDALLTSYPAHSKAGCFADGAQDARLLTASLRQYLALYEKTGEQTTVPGFLLELHDLGPRIPHYYVKIEFDSDSFLSREADGVPLAPRLFFRRMAHIIGCLPFRAYTDKELRLNGVEIAGRNACYFIPSQGLVLNRN